jgi:hypothetical protein
MKEKENFPCQEKLRSSPPSQGWGAESRGSKFKKE